MNIEEARNYCLSLKGVTEELPFGPETLVFKVMGKMFALLPLDTEDFRISLKNTPEKNIELRQEYSFIEGAYHMNKSHWNMIFVDYSVKKSLIIQLIKESYDLVVDKLPKATKNALNEL
jgi:predicted DNA-binding protein (MmcQ/YjbR family)